MEQTDFKKSDVIENIENLFLNQDNHYFDWIDEKNKNPERFCDINKQNVRKAFKTLCQLYNKDNKSRNFVKHIVGAFYPPNPWNKVINFSDADKKDKKNKCALTGFYVCGLKEIAELGAKLLLPRAKFDVAETEEQKKQVEKEFNKIMNSYSAAAKNRTFAYMSDKSDKYLSNDAIIGLQIFVEQCIFQDVKDILFVLNKKRTKQFNKHLSNKNKLSKSQINKVSKAQTYGGMSKIMLGNNAEIAKKLLSIKDEMENKTNNEMLDNLINNDTKGNKETNKEEK